MLFAVDSNAVAELPEVATSIFDVAAPAAQSIYSLAILVFAITALIFLIVEGVLFYSMWRFRATQVEPTSEPPQVYGSQAIELAWTAAPTLIVLFLMLVTTRTLWEVKAHVPEPQANDHTLHVTVIGRQWWWEYVYETYDGRRLGFATANELHLPASDIHQARPTVLRLESADVCHSYWVPRLGGKVDLIPGRINHLTLESSEPGLYLGQCAEYCGEQHAHMLLRVVVDTPEEFDRWLDQQAAPAVEDPAQRAGKDAFLAQSCVSCHRVRGTVANGNYAPDLTHLMSRATLASGMLENTTENLRRWVHDPQSIKVGCLMPAFGLSEADEDRIVSYLNSLR